MKWGILKMALVTLFVLPGIVFATEEWERKLMDEGWVRVKQKLMDRADTTWYGQKGLYPSRENMILYIDPSGNKTYFQFLKGSKIHIGVRSKGEGGKICIQYKSFSEGGRQKLCNRTLWKKGSLYVTVNKFGFKWVLWKIKRGNLENFK